MQAAHLTIYPGGVYNAYIPSEKVGKIKGKTGRFMEEEKCCCHHKTKERSEKEYKDLIHRLNRIEGQIRGIKGMVEKRCLLSGNTGTGSSCQCSIKQF